MAYNVVGGVRMHLKALILLSAVLPTLFLTACNTEYGYLGTNPSVSNYDIDEETGAVHRKEGFNGSEIDFSENFIELKRQEAEATMPNGRDRLEEIKVPEASEEEKARTNAYEMKKMDRDIEWPEIIVIQETPAGEVESQESISTDPATPASNGSSSYRTYTID